MGKLITNKYDLDLLASELAKILILKDGKIHFSSMFFEDLFTVLQTSISLSDKIPEVEKRGIIIKGVLNCGKKAKITKENLMKYIKMEENNFLDLPIKNYKLVTSLSLQHSNDLGSIRLANNYILFKDSASIKYDQSIVEKKVELEKGKKVSKNFTKVIITTQGRTNREAVNYALNNLEFVRGIWNFLLNRLIDRQISSRSYENKPINQILLGPIHTLHYPDGKLLTDNYWYEPFFQEDTKLTNISKNLAYIKRNEKYIRSRIKKLAYFEEIKLIFAKYNNALDYPDHNYSLLSLWSLLESLTGTHKMNNDKTIARTLFIYGKDYEIMKQILEHLRFIRNQLVHQSQRDDRARYLVFQLKKFVEDLISFHINNKFKLNTMNEIGQFLDMSRDTRELQNKLKLVSIALDFRSRKKV